MKLQPLGYKSITLTS